MVHVALTQGLVEKGHSIFPKQERIEQIQINLKWTTGHLDIAGNEIADQLAKRAAEQAETMP